jgi:hypothetical protein
VPFLLRQPCTRSYSSPCHWLLPEKRSSITAFYRSGARVEVASFPHSHVTCMRHMELLRLKRYSIGRLDLVQELRCIFIGERKKLIHDAFNDADIRRCVHQCGTVGQKEVVEYCRLPRIDNV